MAMIWLFYAFSFTFLAIWRFFFALICQHASGLVTSPRDSEGATQTSHSIFLFFSRLVFFQPRHAMPPSEILPNCPALLASWTFG